MWTETKHGLYKQFVFSDFHHAWAFMEKVSAIVNDLDHHPRWQNEWNVVEFWLSTHEPKQMITDRDWELAKRIDAVAEGDEKGVPESSDDKNTTQITEVQLYADGGSRGNPGPSASGYVLLDMDGNIVHSEGVFLGITTNNQAEYQALKFGLEAALRLQARSVHVYMDSMLVVNQMKKIFKVKNRDLWPIHDAIQQLLPKFEKVSFDHVPRELNKLADAEVNKCLDAQLGSQAQRVD
ncbi:reverse transcriptase-like protein [Candidatus Saccharibacteria bacterium]|nr:MAG: reverse transcriptase-like protein [Candidatus Saccharibacteria bacterium]